MRTTAPIASNIIPFEQPGRPGDPCIIVIFGASGDLTKRKLIPALNNLAAQKLVPENFAVLGISRSEMTDETFRRKLAEGEKVLTSGADTEAAWRFLSERIHYMPGDVQKPQMFETLKKRLGELDKQCGTHGNVMFYLAVAPEYFASIVDGLARVELTQEQVGWRRFIIEKPFGHDLPSAVKLNHDIREKLHERQIFRIDHYLGKETVQNLLVFRFANSIFEPIWNRQHIDHVQMTVAEELGVEGRGGYYDQSGALRDMVPNHVAQLISLVGMEPPISFSADAVRDEQVKLLNAVQPPTPEEVLQYAVRGQYGEGFMGGRKVPGYRQENKVPRDSHIETFVALKIKIDNWRWADVPFYIRTGKRLPRRVTEIVIQFKAAPFMLFSKTPVEKLAANRLLIHVAPSEGISLRFGVKVPAPVMRLSAVHMDFNYGDYFHVRPSTGYETLLYDAMIGDATLFQRADMVEAGWRMVQPILDVWQALPPRSFPNYAAGTWGPPEADELLSRDGRHWENFEYR